MVVEKAVAPDHLALADEDVLVLHPDEGVGLALGVELVDLGSAEPDPPVQLAPKLLDLGRDVGLASVRNHQRPYHGA